MFIDPIPWRSLQQQQLLDGGSDLRPEERLDLLARLKHGLPEDHHLQLHRRLPEHPLRALGGLRRTLKLHASSPVRSPLSGAPGRTALPA